MGSSSLGKLRDERILVHSIHANNVKKRLNVLSQIVLSTLFGTWHCSYYSICDKRDTKKVVFDLEGE